MKIKGRWSPIEIKEKRQIVQTDDLKFPWKQDPAGYFLVKLVDGEIHCGLCDNDNNMWIEFRGKDPHNMMKEIAKREITNIAHMGYIAQELMLAKHHLDNNTEFVQR